MQLIAEDVKQIARKEGAELVGIVAAHEMPSSIPPRPPQGLLQEAKSVIVYGIPLLVGSISANPRVNTSHAKTVYGELDRIGYRIGRFIEREGHLAAAVSVVPVEMSKETKGLVGDISFKHAAVGAGLGVWGKCKLVLNPEWGLKVRYAVIVTDALLESDPPLDQDLCLDCNLCVDACPVGALSENGQVDTIKCILYSEPHGLPELTRFINDMVDKPVEEQKRALRDPKFWDIYQYLAIGINYECTRCVQVCPIGR